MRGCLTACCVVFAASLAVGTAEEAAQSQADPIEALQSAEAAQRFGAKSRIIQERRSLIRSLLMIVQADPHETGTTRAELLRLTGPKCLAIKLLGELRAEQAVPTLVQNLTYWVDTRVAGPLGGRGLGARYPAAGSLAKIGNPAVPELVSFLGKSTDPIERHLCVWTLVRIEGRDVGRLRVEKAIESCRWSKMKANLEAALEYFEKQDLGRAPRQEQEKTEGK